MDSEGVLLGNGEGKQVRLTYEQRRQHTYVIGVNGTGKTSLLRQFAYADMIHEPKHGLCVIDPHGDLIDDIISLVPENRLGDVILFDPSEDADPFCLNLFAPLPEKDELGRVASEIVSIFRKIFGMAWTPAIEGVVQNVTLTLLARSKDYKLNGKPWVPAMDEIPALLAMERVPEEDREKPPWRQRIQAYRSQFYQELQRQDQIPVWEFWNYNFDTLTPRPRSELSFAVLNQVRRFLSNPTVRNIVAQEENKLDLKGIMSEGKILLVNLSKGKLGEANSAFLGSVVIAKLVVAVFARADEPESARRPFHVIVDEFQNFAISSFPSLLSEARKYSVDMVIAHQYRDQLRDWVQGATTNAGNVICFRLGGDDALDLAREFDAQPPSGPLEFKPIYTAQPKPALADPNEGVREDLHRKIRAVGGALACLNAVLAKHDETKTYLDSSEVATMRGLGFLALEECLNGDDWASPLRRFGALWQSINYPHEMPITLSYDGGTITGAEGLIDKDKYVSKEDISKIHEAVSLIPLFVKPIFVEKLSEKLAALRAEEEALPAAPSDDHRITMDTIFLPNQVWQDDHFINRHRLERGRPRPFSDVFQEIANSLTHLPNYAARCKLSGSSNPPSEHTFTTVDWPGGLDKETCDSKSVANRKTVLSNTIRDYTHRRADVEARFRTRYQEMLGSIGMSWEEGEALPTPQVLYEEDD